MSSELKELPPIENNEVPVTGGAEQNDFSSLGHEAEVKSMESQVL